MTFATDLLAELERHHVAVERHGNRLKLRAPAPPHLLDRLWCQKRALLAVPPDTDCVVWLMIRFRLPSHPANAWGTLIGPGQTEMELLASLRQGWAAAEA